MPHQRYLPDEEAKGLVELIQHCKLHHTDAEGVHLPIVLSAAQAKQLQNMLVDHNNPFVISNNLGAYVHRAITEADGLADAIDVIIDEMDPDQWSAIIDGARSYLGLPDAAAVKTYETVYGAIDGGEIEAVEAVEAGCGDERPPSANDVAKFVDFISAVLGLPATRAPEQMKTLPVFGPLGWPGHRPAA